MLIEFVYGPLFTGSKIFDFKNLYDDPQGLTGSEHSCFEFSYAMAERGHTVSLYAACNDPILWGKVRVLPLTHFGFSRKPPDVVYVWNEPEMLQYTWEGSLRIVNQQLNDFNYCQPGFDAKVDVFTSPSPSHREYIKQFTPEASHHKWEVLSNCYNPALFKSNSPKKPGSCLWASSVDRGLHLLLASWVKIHEAVPHATLDIYYPYDRWLAGLKDVRDNYPLITREFKQRADYIEYALKEMKEGFGITHHKAVSKHEIAKAFSETQVFPFCCSTPTFTEGFSVSSLEAMGGGCVPIMSSQDSLGQIYGSSGCPMVATPTTDHIEEFTDLTIRALSDQLWANSIREKTINFAANFTFAKEAMKLEALIDRKCKELTKGIYASRS